MTFTDSHAHLGLVAEELGGEVLRGVLDAYSRAWESGGPDPLLVDIGVDPRDLGPRLAALGLGGAPGGSVPSLPPFLRATVGAWPSTDNLADPEASLASLEAELGEAAARGLRIAAIGEGGLDYHYEEGSKEAQGKLFEGLLSLASARALTLVVHSRDAAGDTLAAIGRAHPSSPVLIHCFGYGSEEARSFLDLGCSISFAGNLSYKSSGSLREAIALVPDDRLLLETDAPYLNPMPRRGRPSNPLDIERTYALAAELRGVPVEELAATVSRNALRLFG